MASPPSRSSPGGPFRPTRLGQWEVIAKIAGGGMSAVYLGRRAERAPDVPNVVALKIARHELRMDERMLNMFLEEGKLIARLVHPNIVRTLEVGGDAELDFIAMELMLGKTFASIYDAITVREVRLNPEIVAWTAARIADALHYAHELADESGRPLGLVHRDVNPANVFATFQGEVKLFDFGLAKVTAGDASGSHMLAGKLSYLSPEQIMQMPLDRRSDIFSLGTTLWELLTGRRLFRRDSDLDTVRAVQLGPIPDPRQVAPEVPEELARIAKTALERNREHRYPQASFLARELDAFVYQRSSATEVTARLAQLVDTLFPGEQKRQQGWLKPAIGSRQMAAVMMTPPSTPLSSVSSSSSPAAFAPTSPSITPMSRPSPPTPMVPRETTEVMPNAPLRGRGLAHTDTVLGFETVPSSIDTGLRDSIPGPITPRDPASYAEILTDEVTVVPPNTEREVLAELAAQPPPDPISSTMNAAIMAAPESGTTDPGVVSSRSGRPSSGRPLPSGPLSNRPWQPTSSRLPPVVPPPPLPRARPPARPPASKPPPLPPIRNTDEDISKTNLEFELPPGATSKPPPPRPKKAPIPLPSRSKPPTASVAPKKATTDPPPSSDTQVDRERPPRKR